MSLTLEQKAEIAAASPEAATRRPVAPGLEKRLGAADPGARPRLRPRRRLHGRRRRHRPGRARLLRRRHQDGQRRRRPDPLPDAPPPHDAVRDVRAEAAREAADLRRPPVDPPPHRQRQRVLRPLLDPRPRVLHPRARAPRRPVQASTTRAAATCSKARRPPASSASCCADAEPPTTTTRRCSGRPAGPRPRARPDEPAGQRLHPVVLEDRPAQPLPLPALRIDPHAQYEIRVYAEVLCDVVKDWVPPA